MNTKILKALLPILFIQLGSASGQQHCQPNIVFILADDLGWGDLACYGNQYIKTPNLDKLAASGIQFTQFYASGSVCSPTRASIMCGKYPAAVAMHGHIATPNENLKRGIPDFLDPDLPTLPMLLRQAGYTTAHVGKWHLGTGEQAPQISVYGFDYDISDMDKNPDFDIWGVANRHQSTRIIVDKALEFIESREQKENPFYVQLWLTDPHATLSPSKEQMEPYRKFGPGKDTPHRGASEIYYATVTEIDRQIGRLMETLKEMGIADNTMIIFLSDNGPEDIHIFNASHSAIGSAGPFRGRKRSLYEGGIRVPFIVSWPANIKAGRVDAASVSASVDFLPSLCAIAGAKLPENYKFDGEDMSKSWMGMPQKRQKALMWEWRFHVFGEPFHRSPMLSIRKDNWKLLFNPDNTRIELYDVLADPGEMNNLANKYTKIVKQLKREALEWQGALPKGSVDASAGKNNYPWPK